jgi:mono/diheme cytochrome c family protein
MFSKFVAASLMTLALAAVACVKAQPPTDTGDDQSTSNPLAPTTPNPTGGTSDSSTALSYNQDMKSIFAADCVPCHGIGRADAGYRMTTYAQVMTAVRPGSASSLLVLVTQRNGSMYRYFSGSSATRQAKADAVRTWIVTNHAQENR